MSIRRWTSLGSYFGSWLLKLAVNQKWIDLSFCHWSYKQCYFFPCVSLQDRGLHDSTNGNLCSQIHILYMVGSTSCHLNISDPVFSERIHLSLEKETITSKGPSKYISLSSSEMFPERITLHIGITSRSLGPHGISEMISAPKWMNYSENTIMSYMLQLFRLL